MSDGVTYKPREPGATYTTRVAMNAEGTTVYGNPVMPGPNPHPLWTLDWYVWKELNEGWVPYHTGTRPDGSDCRTMPRADKVGCGMYRCPDCGKKFPTFLAMKAALAQEGPLPCDNP